MSSHEFHPKKPGIEYFGMPGRTEKSTIADVLGFYQRELTGKTLTTHLAVGGPEDIVTYSTIHHASVLEDGNVSLLTEDALGQPAVHQFDGNTTHFAPSIYEENDFWFQDKGDERIWYGIYDEPLSPAYLRFKEE